MPLVDQPFEATFTFSRAVRALVRDEAGVEQTARRNVPRYDHDAGGEPLGLLIEGRPQRWSPDRLRVQAGDWVSPAGTVLHEVLLPGETEPTRSAWYAPDWAVVAVDACLSIKGHHRLIAYLPVYLRNRGGHVRWRRLDWRLGGILVANAPAVIGGTADRPLLEG